MRHPLLFAISMSLMATATSGVQAQFIRPWSPVNAARAAGRELFQQHCAVCHVAQSGAAALAPGLVGVVGRRAGSVPGFPYSNALKNSGIVWTEENLGKWIANPNVLVPGTLMPHVALGDPAERVYLIEYLKTLRAGR